MAKQGEPRRAGADNPIHAALQAIRDEVPGAAERFVKQWHRHLYAVIRVRLARALRSKYDPEDFLQDVWKSFFTRVLPQQQFDCADELVAVLVNLARTKVLNANHRYLAMQKTDVRRERALDCLALRGEHEPVARQLGPREAAEAEEEWQCLVARQPHHAQVVLVLLDEGYTPAEIAKELGVSEKTIHRRMDLLTAPPPAPPLP